MVFGFFSRKPQQQQPTPVIAGSTTPEPSSTQLAAAPFRFPTKQLHTPAPSISISSTSAAPAPAETLSEESAPPPLTPSPPPAPAAITDSKALYALITSVPPQTLHSYCLHHLDPANRSSTKRTASTIGHRRSQSNGNEHDIDEDDENAPSSETLTALTHFFRTLVPPPQLHCMRCHKPFFDLSNTDTSCRVPHDDDSALVERVSSAASSSRLDAAGKQPYETTWGCCGQVVEGDGDQGPPDGWCYEGRHTVDVKRARFRADSTLQDDKLVGCREMGCFRPPVSSAGSSEGEEASVSVRRKRKRTVTIVGDQGDASATAAAAAAPAPAKRRRKAAVKKVEGVKVEEDADDIDPEEPMTKRKRRPRKFTSPAEVPDEDEADDEEETQKMDVDTSEDQPSRPVIRSPPPTSPRRRKPRSTSSRRKPSSSSPMPLSRSVKPKSKLGTSSITAPTFSPASTSESPLPTDKVYVEIRKSSQSRSPVRPHAHLKHQRQQSRLKESEGNANVSDSEGSVVRGRTKSSSKARGARKSRLGKKLLEEVVDSSVACEMEMKE